MKRIDAEVLNARRVGAYHAITVVAPEIAQLAQPGQFISVAPPAGDAMLLRRTYWIAQASGRGGWAGTLEFVADPRDPRDAWLRGLRPNQKIDVLGPLGTAFAYPAKLETCLLVAEHLGAPVMYFLAQELRARGKRVDLVVGGPTGEEIYRAVEAKRVGTQVALATADGSMGDRGDVSSVLASTADACGTQVVYAAGPRPMLRRVADFCTSRTLPAQVVVQDDLACGTGMCFTCVVPVMARDGVGFDHLRACTDGPVFNPARILWDRWGDGPSDPRVMDGRS